MERRHTPTVVSGRTVAAVIRDRPLTLRLAPFRLQIVLHARSSGPEKITLSSLTGRGHTICPGRPGDARTGSV